MSDSDRLLSFSSVAAGGNSHWHIYYRRFFVGSTRVSIGPSHQARTNSCATRHKSSYKKYVRAWGADISLKEFFHLYWERSTNARLKIPKAMDANFDNPQTDAECEIQGLIDRFNAEQAMRIVPIKPENVDAWLKPESSSLASMQAILDDRERPYYEHRMAA